MLGVLNWRIGAAVQFNSVLHGLWAGQGTGTTSIEANLLRQLTAMGEEVIYKVFLDLRKAYDKFDWDICMEILVGYDVGPWMDRIIR